MFIEIERKFEITQKDLFIIKNKCKLKSKNNIEDIYMDNKDYFLLLNNKFCRIRNSILELKDRKGKLLSKEYTGKEAIEKLKKIGINFTDLKKVFTINTFREKYEWKLKNKIFLIDYDKHKYWERYEIEVEADSEEEGSIFIDKIIKNLWLDAIESKPWETKWMLYIKNEVPEIFEKMKKIRIS